jgi:hypothetical protein
MARTVVALYDELAMAQHVVNDLVSAGIPRENISLVANDAANNYEQFEKNPMAKDHVGAVEGSVFGAAVGALTGMLVALTAAIIPGIGPVVVAGPLASALAAGLAGAVTGGATGGIVGGLLGLNIPEKDARTFAEGIRRGGTLVAVQVSDEQVTAVEDVLHRHNPIDVERRAAMWRESGWEDFNDTAKPYKPADISREYDQYRDFESSAPTRPTHPATSSRVRRYGEDDREARV